MTPEQRQRKIAYLRQWYAKNRESEIEKARIRKVKMLSNLTPAGREIYKLKLANYRKVERLRRDLKRSIDPSFDSKWREKRRKMDKRKWLLTQQDPVKKEAARIKHNAKNRDYKRRKKLGELRQAPQFLRIGGKPVIEDKPKKDRLPPTPKGFKKMRKLSNLLALESRIQNMIPESP